MGRGEARREGERLAPRGKSATLYLARMASPAAAEEEKETTIPPNAGEKWIKLQATWRKLVKEERRK